MPNRNTFQSPVPNITQVPPHAPARVRVESRIPGVVRVSAILQHPLNMLTAGTLPANQ